MDSLTIWILDVKLSQKKIFKSKLSWQDQYVRVPNVYQSDLQKLFILFIRKGTDLGSRLKLLKIRLPKTNSEESISFSDMKIVKLFCCCCFFYTPIKIIKHDINDGWDFSAMNDWRLFWEVIFVYLSSSLSQCWYLFSSNYSWVLWHSPYRDIYFSV